MSNKDRIAFFSKNLVRGLIWLAAIILLFLFFREYVNIDFEAILVPLHDEPIYVYLVFALSEIVVGIIPPELFMIWASHHGGFEAYIPKILLLAIISYGAGIFGYWVGRWFSDTSVYVRLSNKFFREYAVTLRKYGSFLILVASLTPLPFSGIAMIVGATGYTFQKYTLVSLARFVRFAVYAYVVWLTV